MCVYYQKLNDMDKFITDVFKHTCNQHFLDTNYDMSEHTQSKYIHNCVIKETQVAVWDMAPGNVDDCCFFRWDMIEAKAACLLLLHTEASAMHSTKGRITNIFIYIYIYKHVKTYTYLNAVI